MSQSTCCTVGRLDSGHSQSLDWCILNQPLGWYWQNKTWQNEVVSNLHKSRLTYNN